MEGRFIPISGRAKSEVFSGDLSKHCKTLGQGPGHGLIYAGVGFYVPMFHVSHHPTIGDISSPTGICFGDVKQIPKKGHLPTPVMFMSCSEWERMPDQSTYMPACIHTHTHIDIHTYILAHTHTHAHTKKKAHTHTPMHGCIYIWIC